MSKMYEDGGFVQLIHINKRFGKTRIAKEWVESMSERSCNSCKYAIFQDVGYSNYTVEGTEFTCAKSHHPDAPFDRWYGEDIRLQFAKACPCFSEGEPIELDVEGEEFANLSDEQKRIYMEWNV